MARFISDLFNADLFRAAFIWPVPRTSSTPANPLPAIWSLTPPPKRAQSTTLWCKLLPIALDFVLRFYAQTLQRLHLPVEMTSGERRKAEKGRPMLRVMPEPTFISAQRIHQDFAELIGDLWGPTSREFRGAADPESATPEDLVFLTQPKYLASVLASRAGGIIVATKMQNLIQGKLSDERTVFLSSQPDLLKAFMLSKYWRRQPAEMLPGFPTIHPSVVIHPTARLGQRIHIAPNVVIGAHVQIADGVSIGANCVIEEGARIGAHTEIAPLVFIGRLSLIGERCRIDANTAVGSSGYGFAPDAKHHFHHIPQQGWVILEDDVEIGANCAIDRGALATTKIGRGTKMDNLCHIAHNCQIGEDCMITASFRVAGSTRIGNRFKCGGGCKMAGHLEIADDVTLAGGTTVTKSLLKAGEYGGHPVMPITDYLKAYANLAHLTQMRKTLSKVMKHLKLESE